ncbi:MAG: helix-turn-helix transcriptional regulator [Clostridia bacterium]|nr:helix-turn-helix transcriptional regulator [Clostridia bacterium]
MFWENFRQLCLEKGKSPNAVAKEIGLSSGSVTKWKQEGVIPREATLKKIADYFGVTANRLLQTNVSASHSEPIPVKDNHIRILDRNGTILEGELTDEQMELVKLMIEQNQVHYVTLYAAAHSEDNRPDCEIQMEQKRWDTVANAPETDEPLL